MSEEGAPFLPTRERSKDAVVHQRWVPSSLFIGSCIHGVMIVIYVVVGILFVNAAAMPSCSSKNAISDLKVNFLHETINLYQSTSFVGPPGPQTDALWDQILEERNIRVSASELAKNARTSVRLPGGEYLAWMGVFHELHCLNLLRQWKYKDHYFHNASQTELESVEKHTGRNAPLLPTSRMPYDRGNHCIDRMRAAFMCHPDLSSLTTFFWDTETRPKVNGTKTLHNCIDWDLLMDSVQQRIVSREEMSAIHRHGKMK